MPVKITFDHNFHTHTFRCHHAEGDVREYVENAIAQGFKALGFSDHSPYPFKEGYISHIRMLPQEMDGYVDAVLSAKKEYAGQIDIHLGVEAEYYPEEFEDLVAFLSGYPMEYMILGQHFLGEERDGLYSGTRTASEEILVRYVDQTIEGMRTGKFLYLAHPDLINYAGKADIYQREMSRLCREAKALGVPLEINGQGVWTSRHYPNLLFWRIAGQEGCPVVLGADAHQPDKIWVDKAVKISQLLIQENHLQDVTASLLK